MKRYSWHLILVVCLAFGFASGCQTNSQQQQQQPLLGVPALPNWLNKKNSHCPDGSCSVSENKPAAISQVVTNDRNPSDFGKPILSTAYAESPSANPGNQWTTAKAKAPVQTNAPAQIIDVASVQQFEELVRDAPGAVLVDFYADWCGPCKRQFKILQQVAEGQGTHHATILKVNVDELPQLSQTYGVRSLPTLVSIQQGKEVDRRKGLANESQIAAMLSR